MKKLLKDLLNASIWFVFTSLALHSLYYSIKFFLLKNEEIMDGNLFDCQPVSIFCLVFGLIILLGIPAMMTITLQKTNLKENKNKLLWSIIMTISLGLSIFGSFFTLFAISELFEISIDFIHLKILTIISIIFNLFCLSKATNLQRKEEKRKSSHENHPFIAKDKT